MSHTIRIRVNPSPCKRFPVIGLALLLISAIRGHLDSFSFSNLLSQPAEVDGT